MQIHEWTKVDEHLLKERESIKRIETSKQLWKLILLSIDNQPCCVNNYSCRKVFHKLNKGLKENKVSFEKPTNQEYKNLYKEVTKKKISEFKDAIQTIQERTLKYKLNTKSGLLFYHSFWFGNHCFDLFTPSLKIKTNPGKPKSVGLFIELNGSIHNKEGKMRKDEHKLNFCSSLCIPVATIENADLNNFTVRHLINSYKTSFEISNSRERRRVMRRAYIETCLALASKEQLNQLIKGDYDQIKDFILKNFEGGRNV